jgi:PTS system beta-glucosides-specific IIC component
MIKFNRGGSKMKKEQTVAEILTAIGGKKNIVKATHCITRLRFNLVDSEKIKLDEIGKIEGVIKAQYSGSELQIILGADVEQYYDILVKEIGDLSGAKVETKVEDKGKAAVFNRFTKGISSVFIPVALAIGSSGMIKAVLAVLVAFDWVSTESSAYTVFSMIGDATFYFLPILIGVSLAKAIGANIYLAASLGGLLVYPTLINGAAEGLAPLKFFGISIPFVSYASSIFPIVLGVFLLKYVHKFLNKFIPKTFEMVLTASLTMLFTSVVTLAVLAPLGDYGGKAIATFFSWLYSVSGPLTGALVGASFALLTMTGFCYGLYPGALNNLGVIGYDVTLIPMMLYANLNQGAAAFAVGLKSKDKKLRANAFSTGTTAMMGIMEPAVYTVNLIYRKPFYAALIGSGVAGGLSALLNIKAFTYAGCGWPALPAFISKDFPGNLSKLMICVVVGLVVTFVVSFLWTSKKEINAEEFIEEQELASAESGQTIRISSVGSGEVVPLNTIPDEIFAGGVLGKTVAIKITNGKIYAPFDSEVITLFPTGHAIGLKSADNVETLIHIGVDTVKLEAGYFTAHVKQGDIVKKGQLLLTFDYDKVSAVSACATVLVTITNSQDYKQIKVNEKNQVTLNDTMFTIN